MPNFSWISAYEQEYRIPEDPDTILCIDLHFQDFSRREPNITTVLGRLDNIPKSERYRVAVVGDLWGWCPSDFGSLGKLGVDYFKTAVSGDFDFVPTKEKVQHYVGLAVEARRARRNS
jgi:hypothetical protein